MVMQGKSEVGSIERYIEQIKSGAQPDTDYLQYPLRGAPFTISGATLARLVEQHRYLITPTGGGEALLLVGIRAAGSDAPFGVWLNEATIYEQVGDYQSLNCLLLIWDRKHHKIALFRGSTLPHITAVNEQRQQPDARVANQLSMGLYNYRVGAHEPEGRPPEEGAFRLSRLQPVPIWRYGEKGLWLDLSVPNDHIHSAQSRTQPTGISYASAGCQVVEGDQTDAGIEGLYQTFRLFAGLSAQPHRDEIGLPYQYLLTHTRHLEAIALGGRALILQHGSQGHLVRSVQEALMAADFLDEDHIDKGYFNGATTLALYRYQQAHQLRADGVITEQVWRHLGGRREAFY